MSLAKWVPHVAAWGAATATLLGCGSDASSMAPPEAGDDGVLRDVAAATPDASMDATTDASPLDVMVPIDALAEEGRGESSSDAGDGADACQTQTGLVTLWTGSPTDQPYFLVTDATFVYWTTPHGGNVWKIALDDCSPATTLASGQDGPNGIGVDATHVYWTNWNLGGAQGTVNSVPISGGAVTTLAMALTAPRNLANAGATLYWTSDPIVGGSILTLNGSTPNVIASAQAQPMGIAADPTGVYWTNRDDGRVAWAPSGGGSIQVIASAQTAPTSIAVAGPYVFWTNGYGTTGTIVRGSLADAGSTTVLAAGQEDPGGIATDGVNVYWTTENGTGTIMKIPVDGGIPVTLASGQDYPTEIAVDATSIYWTNAGIQSGIGRVMKLTPK